MKQIINPANEEAWLELRTKDITSSEVAALFGISPYMTKFELWHRKKDGKVVTIEKNADMVWGLRLQDSIAQGVAEDNNFVIRKMTEYIRDDELKIGSSFDFEICGEKKGILEIKKVRGLIYKDQWLENDDGTVEAPPHIEIQVQHQLMVSGYEYAYIAAFVGENNVVVVRREQDIAVIEAIRKRVHEFWVSITDNKPPEPDFAQDAEFISKLYGYAEIGKVLDASNDKEFTELAKEHKKFLEEEKAANSGKQSCKAKMLIKIGDAEKVLCDGFSITSGECAPTRIEAYDREGYRMFRINWKKIKDKTK